MYTLADYESMQAKTEAELSAQWKETTEEKYWDMLEAVPPRAMTRYAFLVGECLTHGIEGGIYDAFTLYNGKYYNRPAYVAKFNELEYALQIHRLYPPTPTPAEEEAAHLEWLEETEEPESSAYADDTPEPYTDADPGL